MSGSANAPRKLKTCLICPDFLTCPAFVLGSSCIRFPRSSRDLFGGVVPFLSYFFEHTVPRRVNAELAALEARTAHVTNTEVAE